MRTVQETANAYERIPYHLVLRSIIVRAGLPIRDVPEVRFCRLAPSVMAQAIGPAEDGWSAIEIDTAQCAQTLPGDGIPLLAILTHELIHIGMGESGRYGGSHGRLFHSACFEMSCHGFPVVTARKYYPVLEEAEPCDWRRSLAIQLRPPTAITRRTQ